MPSLILVWFLILLTASSISISTVFDTFGLFYFPFIIFCIFFFFPGRSTGGGGEEVYIFEYDPNDPFDLYNGNASDGNI